MPWVRYYFSPEQARGGMVGLKADIYSLGILMYEMLTGDVPFDGETPVAVASYIYRSNRSRLTP